VVDEFVYRALVEAGKPVDDARLARGALLPFGSYQLDIHGPGSDMDFLVLAPNSITYEKFFKLFHEAMSDVAGIQEFSVCRG
jgi:poly(A) polymerase